IAGRSADPGVKAALGDAKGALDKAIDSVEHPTRTAGPGGAGMDAFLGGGSHGHIGDGGGVPV
ncbi:hypothetical protein ACFXPA_49100, partial [Amycolatopsis sp. NPDC059090]|uniref:hypothetical protein n=1 Tax=Amycolatopsis sp. NPDC059090 TaxID=3346723 RepID=UPI00367127CF